MEAKRLFGALLIGIALWYALASKPSPAPVNPCPDGKCPPKRPTPSPPLPKPKPKPWGEGRASVEAKVMGRTHEDGTQIDCDLPNDRHKKNIASRGLGCCVFRSLDHAADWANVPSLLGFPEWMVSKGIEGGGYPSKVDKLIPQIAKDRGYPVPDYIQIESNDLEMLRLASKTGRMISVTYSKSPTGRYGGQSIAHMVNLVSAGTGNGPDGKGWWVVLDNNYPGAEAYEWMSEAEFMRTYAGGGTGWAVILLSPGPPPPPRHK